MDRKSSQLLPHLDRRSSIEKKVRSWVLRVIKSTNREGEGGDKKYQLENAFD